MDYRFSMFSLIFFISASISLFWGIKIIKLNPKSSINRTFLLICVSLSIWSLGFAMANSSTSMEIALIWRRFSAFGWTPIFSGILHFLLLITNQKEDSKFHKYLFFIYIPAIVNMYIFAFSNTMARVQYNLVQTDYGWTNIAVNNGWDYFYYFYYSLYMILSLIMVWKWKTSIKEEIKHKQGNLIFSAILLSALLASLTDIVANSFSVKPLPQMAPLFVLLPVWALYYLARHYDLIDYKKISRKEMIVTESEKQKIFNNISFTFITIGILSFLLEYSFFVSKIENNFNLGYVEGGFFLVMGASMYLVQKIKKASLKEAITILILVGSIPIITLRFLNFSGITVWAFPIVIIIASLIFSKKTLLISTALVSMITQTVIWILKPEQTVVVDESDFIFRIAIFLSALLVGSYVNKMYDSKIQENDFRISFQEMNAKISSDFITINKENADEKINEFLSEIGSFFKADRTYVFLINHENHTMTYSHEWCNEGIEAEVETIENVPLAVFPWWIKELENNKLVYIEDIRKMPKEAINEQEQLIRQNVKSLVSVPVEGKKNIKAFIGIDSVKIYKKWPKEDINLLYVLSNLLSDALTKMESEKEIEYMAYYDNLTSLPNRFLFKDRVDNAINLAKRTKTLISIMFIDLDNFKYVNDTIGHDGGDYLLKEVAKNLASKVRKTDTVARFGGDEYMVMLNNLKDQNDIVEIADNIIEIFSKPFNIQGQEFFVTASIGISLFPIDGESPESLVKNADTAMYQAKVKGKNRYAFCNANMKEQVEKNRTMSNDLYHAMERNELTVYYQPQMDLNNKKIVGVEALLRWKHPELGMIPPKVFIPIAEKNQIINSIGEWVLKTACLQNKKWQDMGLGMLKIGVNLSAIQFINPNISNQVERILKETGLSADYLELEITESIAIKETDFVVEVLNKLKKTGVSIAIDDFGTEYSSLSRLRMLPIDRIKIDMEFIHGIENNEKDKAITSIIINLAKSLGLNVLAEGVETAPQAEFLNQKMCEYVQGFYYYKPMPAHEMEEILKENQKNGLIFAETKNNSLL